MYVFDQCVFGERLQYSRYAVHEFTDILSILVKYHYKLFKSKGKVMVRLCSRILYRIVIEILFGDHIIAILTAQVYKIFLRREKYRRDSIRVILEYYNRKKRKQIKKIEASCHWRVKPSMVQPHDLPHPYSSKERREKNRDAGSGCVKGGPDS